MSGSRDYSLRLYDASLKLDSSQETEPSLPSLYPEVWHAAPVLSLAWHGEALVTTSADGLAKHWSGSHLETAATYRGHSNWLTCSALSQDGRYGVVGCHDTTLSVLDLSALQRTTSLKGHTESISHCAMTSTGGLIISCSHREQSAKLWQGPTYPTWLAEQNTSVRAQFTSLTSPHQDGLWTLSLSSAARACGFVERLGLALVGDGAGQVHAVPLASARAAQVVFNQHSAAVTCLAVAGSETILLVGYADGLTVAMDIPPAWATVATSTPAKGQPDALPAPSPQGVSRGPEAMTTPRRTLKRGASLRDSARRVMLLNRWAASAGVATDQSMLEGRFCQCMLTLLIADLCSDGVH